VKLFYYDTKHNNVIATKDLGNLSTDDRDLVNAVINFLYDEGIMDGCYREMTLAESCKVKYYEDKTPYLSFNQ